MHPHDLRAPPPEDIPFGCVYVLMLLALAAILAATGPASEPTGEPVPVLLESHDDSADTGAGELPWV